MLAGAAAASLPTPDLTNFVRYGDQCQPSPAFDQMLGSLLSIHTDGTVRKGRLVVPLAFRQAFGRARLSRPRRNSDMWLVSVPVSAQWRGLRLRSIEQDVVPNTGVGGFSLYFAESAERVREELKQLGYWLTPDG